MDKKETPGLEVRDPKLPAIRAERSGSAMEARRRGAPLPADLADAMAQQQCAQ